METKKQKTKKKKSDLTFTVELEEGKETKQEMLRKEFIEVMNKYLIKELSQYDILAVLEFVKQDLFSIME